MIKEVLKRNRFGEYVERTALLQVGYKTYSVKQCRHPNSQYDPKGRWRLTRSQLVNILEATRLGDWFVRWKGHYDGFNDGWEYDNEDFQILTEGKRQHIIERVKRWRGYYIYYDAETGIFDIYDNALESLQMKPSKSLVVAIR
jgi:hypothetical protein